MFHTSRVSLTSFGKNIIPPYSFNLHTLWHTCKLCYSSFAPGIGSPSPNLWRASGGSSIMFLTQKMNNLPSHTGTMSSNDTSIVLNTSPSLVCFNRGLMAGG